MLEARVVFRDLGTNLNIPGFAEKRDSEPGKLVCPGICEFKDIYHQNNVYGHYPGYLDFLYQVLLNFFF